MKKSKRYDFSQSPIHVIKSLARSETVKHSQDNIRGTTFEYVSKIMKDSKQVNMEIHRDTIMEAMNEGVKRQMFTTNGVWFNLHPNYKLKLEAIAAKKKKDKLASKRKNIDSVAKATSAKKKKFSSGSSSVTTPNIALNTVFSSSNVAARGPNPTYLGNSTKKKKFSSGSGSFTSQKLPYNTGSSSNFPARSPNPTYLGNSTNKKKVSRGSSSVMTPNLALNKDSSSSNNGLLVRNQNPTNAGWKKNKQISSAYNKSATYNKQIY